MTLEELVAIKARADAATPGPWTNEHWFVEATVDERTGQCFQCRPGHLPLLRSYVSQGGFTTHIHGPGLYVSGGTGDGWREIASLATGQSITGADEGWSSWCGIASSREDADFIAHARMDIPNLLAGLSERDAQIERLRAALLPFAQYDYSPETIGPCCSFCDEIARGDYGQEHVEHLPECPVRVARRALGMEP